MKPFDSKGEYTPAEVKAALAGVNGTRQLSFRYERLDSADNFIESIDYIQSCSIENNALADIKRTAKFDILDTGRMNYLQDRIKPYIRLEMPKDYTYAQFASNLNPSTWWKMDDPDQTLIYTTVVNPTDDTSYSTFSTAYNMNEGDMVYAFVYPPGTVGFRSVFWAKLIVSTPNPVDIRAMIANSGLTGPQTTLKSVYTQPSTGNTEASLVPLSDVNVGSAYNIEQLYPTQATYYFKFENLSDSAKQQVQLEWARPRRVSDSSVNGNHGLGKGIYLQKPSIVQDGGKAISAAGHVTTPIQSFTCGTAMSGSMWYTPSDIPRKVIVSEYWETEGSYESGKGQSDLEFWADFDLGTINLYGGFDAYAFDIRLTKTIGIKELTKVKHYAWSMDWMNSRFSVWLDGVRHVLTIAEHGGGSVADITKIPVTNFANRLDLNCSTGSSVPNYVDDVLVFTGRELSDTDAKSLYKLGITYSSARSGYVEWPQGVFVLSSPKRTMVEGNYVHRGVEGYDKLVVLKEDSFDYRYSVPAGTKYTDAVLKVLNVAPTPTADIQLTSAMWTASPGTVINSPTSATLTDSATNSLPQLYTNTGAPALSGASLSAKMTLSANIDAELYLSVNRPDGAIYNLLWTNDYTTGNIQVMQSKAANQPGGWSRVLWSTAYSPTTHAYWKVAEDSGTVTWYTSADGVTWTSRFSIPTPYSPTDPINFIIDAGFNGANTGTVTADFIKANTGVTQTIRLTSSTAVLPTALEWETGTPKLTIINDLLSAINYDSATYDESGVFSARPYITPDKRAAEFIYATDASSVISGDVNQTVDIFKIPNKWVAVVSEADRPPLVSTYTNTNPLSPTSTVARGRTIVDFRTEQKAVDQLTLDNLTTRLAFEASQVYEVIEFETGIMPIHQNADVYVVSIDGLAVNAKFSEHKWSMSLENGGTMKHTVRRVVSL